jgi:hypothetical protein
MTPDRLRGWLAKVPAGSVGVEMCVDTSTGLVELANWERAEVDELRGQADGDVAEAMIQSAQEFADGEEQRQKFIVRWRGKRGKFLKTCTHWARPAEAEGEEGGVAPGISDATIIRDMLRAGSEKDKVLLQTATAATQAATASAAVYERTIAMLSTRLEQAYQTVDQLKAAAETSALPVVVSEASEAEAIQRTEALRALTEKLPDLIDLGITAMANKLLAGEPAAVEAAAAAAADAATEARN